MVDGAGRREKEAEWWSCRERERERGDDDEREGDVCIKLGL